MIFFDDEIRNIEEVSRMGVTTVRVMNGVDSEIIARFL
jgi:hypothetical protein